MSKNNQNNTATSKTLMTLFWPCFFEVLFLMLAGMIDTFMLSALNDKAVGGVGTANTYLSILIIMFSITSTGMVAVMTQYIGAHMEYVAKKARNLGLLLNTILGVILSLILGLFAKEILTVMGIATTLLPYATSYMKIIGGACIITAILPIFNSYLRSFGHTKEPMYATIFSNILNLILNAIFLFVLKLGVEGVAIATVISKIINLLIVIICSERNIHIAQIDGSDTTDISSPIISETSNNIANKTSDKKLSKIANKETNKVTNKTIFKQIIKIGIPGAAETALYELSMAIIIMFLNQMDPEGINVTARTYAATITNFSYCAGIALASSNCILLGWNIGKKDIKKCYKDTARALKYGLIVAFIISVSIFLLAMPLLRIFTSNKEIIKLSTYLLFIDIFLELGRIANLVFANALKTAGDALYIVIVASIIMLLVGAGGTYILGIKAELLAIGAYISMALDEIIRGIISYFRFHSGKWESKTLV